MIYRDSKGRFASFPQKFIDEVIKPMAKRREVTTKEYIRQNKADLKKLLRSNKSEHTTNKIGAERLIRKLDNKTKIFIYNGVKKYSCDKVQLLSYISKVHQNIVTLGLKYINFKYVQINGFETVIFILPDNRILEAKINEL